MSLFSQRRRVNYHIHDIPTKANRILHLVLIAMLLILARVWHLSFIQYEQKLEESQKPQRKTLIVPAVRATIRDRFNLPLAINKMSYQATLLYSQLRDIPSIVWQKDSAGKSFKVYKRKTYIHLLAQKLAEELNLSAEKIEDLIYAKVFYYSSIPFVIKEDLTEEEYYRLKMLEKDWPGLHVRHLPKRFYPKGRVGGDVIGYMGAINRQEYEKIFHEMKGLEEFLQAKENGEEGEEIVGIKTAREARRRLKDLEAKAYTIHDYIGKLGIEGVFEEQLRGFYGKKNFYVDSKGNFLRELPGSRPPLSGDRILLTLSSELQEYAEQLLAQNEALRVVRKSGLGAIKQTSIAQKEPWIKGGAIVVMDPQTAEILTLASYPRFNPNDFISSGSSEEKKEKKSRINQWLENEANLAQLWNQQVPLQRERYHSKKQHFYEEEKFLTWTTYLNFILPKESRLRQVLDQMDTLSACFQIQQQIKKLVTLFPHYSLYSLFNLLYASEGNEVHRPLKGGEKEKLLTEMAAHQETLDDIKKGLDPFLTCLPRNYDKVLLVDLCRLAVDETKFSLDLIQRVENETVENYHDQTQYLVTLLALVKEKAKDLYHELDFKHWRQREEKTFLKKKRLEEKLMKTHSKPYIDYLEQEEQTFFKEFWRTHCWDCLYAFLTGREEPVSHWSSVIEEISPYLTYFCAWHQEMSALGEYQKKYEGLKKVIHSLPRNLAIEYLQTLRSYEELNRPLLGSYRYLRQGTSQPNEKQLAAAFYPSFGFGYGRSYAYRQSAIQGSLFKLVTAYAVLVQRFQQIGRKVISVQDLNPLIMVDEVFHSGHQDYVGYNEEGKPIPQLYKGGRLPRSLAHKNNGRLDLLKAIEVSSNPYFALLAGECLAHPDDLSAAARLFSYGSRTGIHLSGEIAGHVPQDLATNRTGLYAMAIGQHSLVVTPLQTAVMMATIVNGGKVLKPKIVQLMAGGQPSKGDDQIICLPTFPFQEAISLVGIDFPLFSAVSHLHPENLIKLIPTEVQREIFMPEVIRQLLLKGLRAATLRTHQENMTSLARLYREYPEAIGRFTELKEELLGKTSTSESVENIDLDLEEGTNIYTHVWFGSTIFNKKKTDKHQAILLLKDEQGEPEVVIIVYLRYGGYGKEAAPLAAQIAKKWREIKQKHQRFS